MDTRGRAAPLRIRQYRSDLHQVWCACHNGHGHNVSGPPPRPLEAFQIHARGDEIVVSRKREG